MSTPIQSGIIDFSQITIPSAATCDIGKTTSACIIVSGTATITSFGTVANRMRFVTFSGALVLTYNAASLILPTAANITTAAGDSAIFSSDGSGNWRCIEYLTASGAPLAITVAKSAIIAALGYTPLNVAGDTATGQIAAPSFVSTGTVAVGIAGAFLQWNRTTTDGAAWLINQKGTGAGGFRYGEVNLSNVVTTLLTVDAAGNLTATGNVTGYSDETLKTNWRDLPRNFVERLAAVKSGVFDRLDVELTQVGVGAQSLREVLPEAVSVDPDDGWLRVAYGNAALAACVALARRVVDLETRLTTIERGGAG